MTQAEDIARSLISDNIDEITERITVGLVRDYHNIHEPNAVRSIGEKFGGSIATQIINSEKVTDYLLEVSADNETDLRNRMKEHLDEDIDNGDIIFNIAQNVATDDDIKNVVIDEIADMVSTYNGYDASTFTAFAKTKGLDELVQALNSSDYDALYEEYIDNQE